MYIQSQISTYVSKLPNKTKLAEFPLTMIDLSKIDGIQKDIPLFDGVSMPDIAFITKHLETLNLFRGCKIGCTHCLKNAIAPKKGRESILFEDLQRFVDGFSKLSERLGFNALNGNKYLNIIDDSNPIDLPIKGLSKEHSVSEAMKLIYEKLNIPTLFVTSGWDIKGKNAEYSKQAAKDIVKMVQKNSESVADIQISVNPFMKVQNYAERMAEALETFLELFKIDKARIIYRHSDKGFEGTNEAAARNLYEKIYKLLQKITDSKLEQFPMLKPEAVTEFDKHHLIEPSGRGRRYFSYDRNMQLQQELINDAIEWNSLTKNRKKQILQDNAVKCIDIDGSVYTTKPSSAEYVATPIELTIPTDIKLNYINKEKPNKIFSDINIED